MQWPRDFTTHSIRLGGEYLVISKYNNSSCM